MSRPPLPTRILTALITGSLALTVSVTAPAAGAQVGAHLRLGVYAGPDGKGVTGARDFDRAMHQHSTEILDFPPLSDWAQVEGESWLLGPHAGQTARLEYSLPVVPDVAGASLARCASGAENPHWRRLAHHLVDDRLADTIVRPGWEFNGNWFRWGAARDPRGFARCFRQVVRTMRRVPGERFRFDWNVAVGPNAFPAELAWPGRRYVDVIGVDVYDMSWTHYAATHAATAADQRLTRSDLIDGDHGLEFWARFARQVHRPLALPEWGVTWLADGHGGGDDPAFVSAIFAFARSHRVAYARYFDATGPTVDHALVGRTRFPRSAARYRSLARAVG